MFIRRVWNRATAPFQLLYWQMTLPQAEGVKLLIECDEKFLMIRETYGPQHWTFPGGRMKHHETPEDAARRKAKEEVGVTLGDTEYLGSYFHTRQYKRDAICVFCAKTESFEHTPSTTNVAESAWFTLEEMDTLERSESVDDALELYHRRKDV
ncbi:MAG: hypothetical protein JWL82_628 [Parcubacteria group bacterium]|nr:hypothetical protein [Parcubacteria group bacterium]